MTVRELDRLVSKTKMTPISKKGLRHVRKAIMSGRTGDAEIGRASWSVAIDSSNGTGMKVSFSFKKD